MSFSPLPRINSVFRTWGLCAPRGLVYNARLSTGPLLSWLERYLDMVEVGGSNPPGPTTFPAKVLAGDACIPNHPCGLW